MKWLFQFTWLIEAGLGTCSFDVSFPSLPLAREDDPCPRKAQTNTPPPTLMGRDQQNPTAPWELSRRQEKTGLLPTLAFCYMWHWTALIKDFCLNPIHKLKPNFNFPGSIFWLKTTFLIFSSFWISHAMLLKSVIHKIIPPQYSKHCC